MTEERFRALILRTIKWGESDLIIHLLTDRGERKGAIAKGALRSKKRFGGGVLEPFHLIGGQLKSSLSKGQDRLSILCEAELLEDFAAIREQYEKIELAAHFLKVIARVTREGDHPDPRVFELLGHGLTALAERQNLILIQQVFEIKLLWLLGVLPLELQASPLLALSLHEVDQSSPLTSEGSRAQQQRIRQALERVVEDGRSE